jgi:hypothetical protein
MSEWTKSHEGIYSNGFVSIEAMRNGNGKAVCWRLRLHRGEEIGIYPTLKQAKAQGDDLEKWRNGTHTCSSRAAW